MRRVGFSKAWNMFVQLGMTDDSYTIGNSEGMSYREYVNLFLPYSPTNTVELKLRHYLKIDQDDIMWEKLMELHLFDSNRKIALKNATPAQILQRILEDSWTLASTDKDMIVMYTNLGTNLTEKGNSWMPIQWSLARTVPIPPWPKPLGCRLHGHLIDIKQKNYHSRSTITY